MIVYFISLGFVLLMYISQNQIRSMCVGSETALTLELRSKLSKAVSVNITSFQLADFQYGQNNDYVEMLNHINQLKNLSNEKQCFHRLVPYIILPPVYQQHKLFRFSTIISKIYCSDVMIPQHSLTANNSIYCCMTLKTIFAPHIRESLVIVW